MKPIKRAAQVGFVTLLIGLLFFGMIKTDVGEANAQLDATAQQQTADAMIAQMFAGTQTALAPAVTSTLTPDLTPTPVPLVIPAPIIISIKDFSSVEDVVTLINALSVSASSSVQVNFSIAPASPVAWEYLVVTHYRYDDGSNSPQDYFRAETEAVISDGLRNLIEGLRPGVDNPYPIFSAAGAEGWELMPVSELSGFGSGPNFPITAGTARYVFKRPVY
ncbi:MAG: hypothetical protein JNM70_19270 [Anaerolineae bacterium]|nr:hypothetical protein [Anaerolineae bacterium]